MTDPNGARKMVCQIYHIFPSRNIPNIYVSIFLPAPWIRHGYGLVDGRKNGCEKMWIDDPFFLPSTIIKMWKERMMDLDDG